MIALAGVTGLDLRELSGMVGRHLPFFSLIVPFWLIWAFVGFRGMLEVWPALLVAGVSFAIPQFWSRTFTAPGWSTWWPRLSHGLPGAVPAVLAAEAIRSPRRPRDWSSDDGPEEHAGPVADTAQRSVVKAWMPWLILSVFVFLWGSPQFKALLDGIWSAKSPIAGLNEP